jgi:hypothetical protein
VQSTHAIVLNALQRVQRFMGTNDPSLGTLNASGYRRILDDVTAALSEHAVTQAASRRVGKGETAKQRVLRNALRLNHMRPISMIAAAQLKQVPEFTALQMPSSNSTSRRLIAAAGAMATAAETYATTFSDAGLPIDFLKQLRGAADALNSSIANRGATATAQSGATAGLKAQTSRGRETIKVLDSLVEPLLAGDAVLLAQWKAAKRISRSRGVSSVSLDAAASGTATIPEPMPADAGAAPVAAVTL